MDLVDAIGKYTAGRIGGKGKVTDFKFYGGKTKYAKMKNWVSRAIHHLQNFFGIRNKEDAARIRMEIAAISGERVFKGEYAKDYMPIEVRTRHQTKPATKPIQDKLKGQKLLQFSITNNTGGPSNIQFASLRVV